MYFPFIGSFFRFSKVHSYGLMLGYKCEERISCKIVHINSVLYVILIFIFVGFECRPVVGSDTRGETRGVFNRFVFVGIWEVLYI